MHVNSLGLVQLQTGDILAFRGAGFWSRLIGLRTTSRVSHVGVVFATDYAFDDGESERLEQVIEAKEGRGVRHVALDDYLGEWSRVDVYRPQNVTGEAVRWLLRQGEQGYATAWQFVWSWGRIASWFRRWLRLPSDIDPRRTHCSEFASRFLALCGYELPEEPPAMSPADVVDLPLIHLGRIR